MKRICAWCKKDLSEGDSGSVENESPITHGICPDCVEDFFSFKAKPLTDFLDRFSCAVFVVNADNVALGANRAGRKILGIEVDIPGTETLGKTFRCKHSSLPGGCGRTVHCKTCTINNTMNDTIETGKAHLRVPALADLHAITGETKPKFRISTEKIGEVVLLRIDDIT